LSRRCVVFVLLLLADLFHELLDRPTLLDAVALGVMHRALLAAVVTNGQLMWVLVVVWAMAPTSRCSYSDGRTG
jgi:hypothetical protein